MKYSSGLCALFAALLCSCSGTMTSPIAHGARARDHGRIGAGEGPAWQPGDAKAATREVGNGFLYFTDGSHINRMDYRGRVQVFRDAPLANSANGLMFDREGRLIACESGARRVTRTERDGRITVLADRMRMPQDSPVPRRKFNTPNDLTQDSKGRIYFTDPRYGPRDDMQIRGCDGPPIEGVYRIDAPGHVTLLNTPGVERPNGILVSPGDQYLYICDNNNNTHGGSRKLVRFRLDKEGNTIQGSRAVIFDWKGSRGPDGMKMDQAGRLYVSAGVNKSNEYETDEFKAGCYILSPSGRLLAFVPTSPDEATNCAFGGPDRKTLYITSGNHLWSIPVNTPGWSVTGR